MGKKGPLGSRRRITGMEMKDVSRALMVVRLCTTVNAGKVKVGECISMNVCYCNNSLLWTIMIYSCKIEILFTLFF